MKISFFGAVEGVTGSNYYLETKAGTKFLVDCGLFQGEELEAKNYDELPYNPKELDFALITHSHMDHMGRIPLLAKKGFDKKIHVTEPTAGFAEIFLTDSCKILANDAKDNGRQKLYEQEDVQKAVSLLETHCYCKKFNPSTDVTATFFDAGHILGSSFILIEADGKKIVFSGDLGNPPVPILRDTDAFPEADYAVLESTYGDKNHDRKEERKNQLERIIEETISNEGVLLMPSFAMERTQEILYELNDLINNGKITDIPIYIDSPLAIKATKIYREYPDYFDKEAKEILLSGDDFFNFKGLTFIDNFEQSKALQIKVEPKVIIAGSGMSNGGRIVLHEKRFLPEKSTSLAIVGFQVKGTLGRSLKEGAKNIEIMGEPVPVRAKIHEIGSYSAHADQQRLTYWIKQGAGKLQSVFLVHGEEEPKNALMHKIQDETGIKTIIPKPLESFEL